MSTESDPLGLLERALNQMDTVVSGIRREQGALPTPCPDWDVQAVIRHLVGHTLPNFTAAARGETPDWQAPAAGLDGDWSELFRSAASELLATWRAADLDQLVDSGGGQAPLRSRADQQIAELAVHSWDLARATGQRVQLDPGVAKRALAWSRPMLRPEYRGPGRAFGAEIPVPPAAPAYDRLAGWFGRDPAWKPPAG